MNTTTSQAPAISRDDRQSAVWLRHKQWLEARLATLRTMNDNQASAEETAHLRGQIAEVKLMLRLDNLDPLITD